MTQRRKCALAQASPSPRHCSMYNSPSPCNPSPKNIDDPVISSNPSTLTHSHRTEQLSWSSTAAHDAGLGVINTALKGSL